ncbi:hypothetical protein ACFPRL_06150 [Pseudoclavibacter helvolus]
MARAPASAPASVRVRVCARVGAARRLPPAFFLRLASSLVSGWLSHFGMGCNPSRSEKAIPRLTIDGLSGIVG